jgi:type III secretion protein L
MSGIIKSERADERVRAFLNRAPSAPLPIKPQIDPELAHARTELAYLSELLRERDAQIVDLKEAIVDLKGTVEQVRREGEAEGRRAGFAEGSQHAAQAIAALTKGVDQALEALASDVENLERLALCVAEAALDRVLGPDADQKALVAQIVARQIELLGGEAVLLIEVSGGDFTAADLAQIRGRHPSIEFRAYDELARGGCRIKLRLGSLEVGPNQQWAALKNELSKIAASASP